MRNRKGAPEVFSISLIDLISGALGVMSILFFTIIPNIGIGTIDPTKKSDKIESLKREFKEVVTYHLYYKNEPNALFEKDVKDSITSLYMLENNKWLLKATYEKDKIDRKINLLDPSAILEGSFIKAYTAKGVYCYNFNGSESSDMIKLEECN